LLALELLKHELSCSDDGLSTFFLKIEGNTFIFNGLKMDIRSKMVRNSPKSVVVDRDSENRIPRENGPPKGSRVREQSVAHFLL
jgi:hypothetical protein